MHTCIQYDYIQAIKSLNYNSDITQAPAVIFQIKRTEKLRDFPSGPVVKALASPAVGKGLIPGQGTRFHMLWVTAIEKKVMVQRE